jgi:hypothetical protein
VISNTLIYLEKKFFTEENISGFLYKYFHEKEHKPHFKKATLAAAAVGSALLYWYLCYPLTMKINKVILFVVKQF